MGRRLVGRLIRRRGRQAGPWWDTHPAPPPEPPELDGVDVAALEAEVDDVAGHRPALQAQARQELAAEPYPLTRSTVVARAVQILPRRTAPEDAA